MDEGFWIYFSIGMIVVSLTGLCISTGYILKTIGRMLEAQKFILDHQVAVAKTLAHGGASHQMMAANNWREMPPDMQLMFRNALVDVLREMDAELPARN